MRVLLVGDDPNDHNLHQKGAPFYNALRPNARLMRPYVHPLNVADFKGIRAG
jgi:hypothetical protein